ncbi:hypothetical protein FE783_29815 [Paenibacillus mesophilus]|uniref:hypothetical protein n=1 Tax=Paenibacillus mesophilus TaxID=2582849 RepID=UPI00110DF731|nr:hypothetical protein [Paenibacillus mesophilus]TMV45292.1 hypothetical protein FE783_29815 [Paenibacillus mesophilus]
MRPSRYFPIWLRNNTKASEHLGLLPALKNAEKLIGSADWIVAGKDVNSALRDASERVEKRVARLKSEQNKRLLLIKDGRSKGNDLSRLHITGGFTHTMNVPSAQMHSAAQLNVVSVDHTFNVV